MDNNSMIKSAFHMLEESICDDIYDAGYKKLRKFKQCYSDILIDIYKSAENISEDELKEFISNISGSIPKNMVRISYCSYFSYMLDLFDKRFENFKVLYSQFITDLMKKA